MRYLPLTADDRAEMLAVIGAPVDRRAVRRRARQPRASPARSTCRRTPASWRSSGRWRGLAGAQPAGRRGAVLLRRRGLSPPCAGQRRPPHPALGIPDQLHALPAGDRPGHAAGAVRVPDPGRGPDRPAGGQRLDVRRLDRLRRGGDDGRAGDPAAPRRCSPAACIRTTPRPPGPWPTRPGVETVRLPAAIDGEAAVIAAIDADTACVVVQTPNVFGTVTDVTRHRRGRPRRRRPADRGDHRGGLASAC